MGETCSTHREIKLIKLKTAYLTTLPVVEARQRRIIGKRVKKLIRKQGAITRD